MKLEKLITLSLLCVAVATPLQGQSGERFEHAIQSEYPSQERTFTVQLPPSYASQDKFDYPVLYVLDGETNLKYSTAVAEFLADNALIPEFIFVGVHAGPTRARDYLPTNPVANHASGEADQFLSYFEHELIPFVEENYRAAPFRLISGHSYSGVLVTYALVERPVLFDAYLTQSPYLDQTIGDPLTERLGRVVQDRMTGSTFYFLNVGDEPNLEGNFERLQQIFVRANSDSFVGFAERALGATHMSTRMVGLHDGLVRLFSETWPLANESLASNGVAALDAHIQALSSRYGYPILYNEQVYQQATQVMLSQQNIAGATAAARRYVTQYSRSPIAHFLLGSALASGGVRDDALRAMETAITLYEQNPKPDLAPMYEAMKSMRERLAG